MQVVSHIVSSRLMQIFRLGMANRYISILMHCIFLLFTIFQAIGIYKIFNQFIPSGLISAAQFMALVKGGICFIVLFSGFFPQYKPFQNLFLLAYPISSFKRAFFQFIYLLIDPFYFYTIVFISTFFVIGHTALPLFFFITLYAILLFACIILQVVKIQIQTRLYFFESLIISLFMFLVFYFSPASKVGNLFIIAILPILFLLYWRLNYLFETKEQYADNTRKSVSYEGTASALLKTKNIRIVFLVALVLKLVYGVLLVNMSLNNKFTENYFLQLMLPVICSPAIYFTYIFNNLFGFKRQIFLYVGYVDTLNSLRKYFFNSILAVLAIDYILSFAFLLFAKISPIEIFSFLFITTINCFFIGFASSFMFPKKILKAIELHRFSNTHIGGSFLLIFMSVGVAYCLDTQNYVILIVSELIILLFFGKLYMFMKNKEWALYQKTLSKIF